jgi:hypothetical protein
MLQLKETLVSYFGVSNDAIQRRHLLMAKVKLNDLKVHLITFFLLLQYNVGHILNINHCIFSFGLE